MNPLATVFVALLLCLPRLVVGQSAPEDPWSVYRSTGEPTSVETLLSATDTVDVVLVGEVHDDTLGHRFQQYLLRSIAEFASVPVILSLEMFERDVQLVVDEYLAGLITEQHFLASSRPWPAYRTAYRPLVEYARERGMRVVAANPPRRYVNLVAREGMDALDGLFFEARRHLPERPLPEPSSRYRDTFFDFMSEAPAHGADGPSTENLFDAQRVWDAGMAESIVRALDRVSGARVLHIAGSFHVEEKTGIPEMLLDLRPELRLLVVVIRPEADGRFAFERHYGLGDFVVISHDRTE